MSDGRWDAAALVSAQVAVEHHAHGMGKQPARRRHPDVSGFDLDQMKPSVIAAKREKQFIDHVYKCFTFGKPVRRIDALADDSVSRCDEIKSKFNRVRLIRRFFSIKRRNLNRKFDYPIDQLGRIQRKI